MGATVDDLLADYRRATALFEFGDPLGAARLLEPIVEAEPEHTSVRLLLARAYFHSAQLGRAQEQFLAVLERDPTDHYARFALGRTLERMGRPADALPHLRMAAAMHPDAEYVSAAERLAARVRGAEP
jgi:Flp pilus assembly protein TadD